MITGRDGRRQAGIRHGASPAPFRPLVSAVPKGPQSGKLSVSKSERFSISIDTSLCSFSIINAQVLLPLHRS